MKLHHIIILCAHISLGASQPDLRPVRRSLGEGGSAQREVGIKLPPLFQPYFAKASEGRQREIKGNHAGTQILAMGILKQYMRNPEFRKIAQQEVRSQVNTVVDYLVKRAKPSQLGEDGVIPSQRIVPLNDVGDCSLHFYRGRFNVSRNGRIKRIPKCDMDNNLGELDEKTINSYLSIAKIGMSKCSDDSIRLNSHMELHGGVWQLIVLNNLMFILQGAGRSLWLMTTRQAVNNYATILQERGAQLVNYVAPQLSPRTQEVTSLVTNALAQVGAGAAQYTTRATQSLADNVATIGQNALTNLTEVAIDRTRGTHSLPSAQQVFEYGATIMDQGTERVVELLRQNIVPGAGIVSDTIGNVVLSRFPDAAQEATTTVATNATSWAWLGNLMEFSWVWPF